MAVQLLGSGGDAHALLSFHSDQPFEPGDSLLVELHLKDIDVLVATVGGIGALLAFITNAILAVLPGEVRNVEVKVVGSVIQLHIFFHESAPAMHGDGYPGAAVVAVFAAVRTIMAVVVPILVFFIVFWAVYRVYTAVTGSGSPLPWAIFLVGGGLVAVGLAGFMRGRKTGPG